VVVERSFLPGREGDRVFGRVAGSGTYAVVSARTRGTEYSRDGRHDEHDAESRQALPFRRFALTVSRRTISSYWPKVEDRPRRRA
jgi:hypothetical protein